MDTFSSKSRSTWKAVKMLRLSKKKEEKMILKCHSKMLNLIWNRSHIKKGPLKLINLWVLQLNKAQKFLMYLTIKF
jgi:hypothetical protein